MSVLLAAADDMAILLGGLTAELKAALAACRKSHGALAPFRDPSKLLPAGPAADLSALFPRDPFFIPDPSDPSVFYGDEGDGEDTDPGGG
jgi:hypothetical protein